MENKRTGLQHEDTYKRINYLYQAAQKCLQTSPADLSLCRYYVYTLRTVTKRLTLHMHPNMKRTMCRRCCVLLLPGLTAMVRERNKRQKHAVVTCLECGTLKRYVGVANKIPWIDKEESWQEFVTNGVLINRPQSNQQSRKKNKGNQKQKQNSTQSTDILPQSQTTNNSSNKAKSDMPKQSQSTDNSSSKPNSDLKI